MVGRIVVLGCLWSSLAVAQTGSLTGRVLRDSVGTPIADAEVSIPTLGRQARADAAGRFRLDDLPAGRHPLLIRKIGYRRFDDTLTITAGAETRREVRLAIDIQYLDSVRVAAAPRAVPPYLRDFEERRKVGIGRFITAEELRKSDNRRLGDVLQKLPGVRIIRVGSFSYLASTRGPSSILRGGAVGEGLPANRPLPGGCYPAVWLDNVRLFAQGTGGQVPDLDRLQVRQFAAVEFYAGAASIPPQFNTAGSACGVLVLWTRIE